jgi:hypothetical protein
MNGEKMSDSKRKIKNLKKAELVQILTDLKLDYDERLQYDEEYPEEDGWLGDDDLVEFVRSTSELMRSLEI